MEWLDFISVSDVLLICVVDEKNKLRLNPFLHTKTSLLNSKKPSAPYTWLGPAYSVIVCPVHFLFRKAQALGRVLILYQFSF